MMHSRDDGDDRGQKTTRIDDAFDRVTPTPEAELLREIARTLAREAAREAFARALVEQTGTRDGEAE
jgi:hypothetical protein